MKKESEWWILVCSMFILLPYLITVLILGRSACPVSKTAELEEYVAGAAASQIPWGYQKETIKAQVVLARTNLYLEKQAGKEQPMLKEISRFFHQKHMNSEKLEQFAVFQEAAVETKGEILTKNGEAVRIPYHDLSAGKTRDGKEILGDSYAYIPSVEVTKDIDSPLYVEGCYFSFQELEKHMRKQYRSFAFGEEKIVEVKKTDAADYVMEVQIGNQMVQGETIREILDLPSSCFTVQISGDKVRFLCKGRGHGLGMSQYGAEQMALEGKNYKEILNLFFPELSIEKRK